LGKKGVDFILNSAWLTNFLFRGLATISARPRGTIITNDSIHFLETNL